MVSLPKVRKEILVVDDGSVDGTREWLSENLENLNESMQKAGGTFHVILHRTNSGKGLAVRTGLQAATLDVIVIQDADLEYDPADWSEMFSLFNRGVADVVYGSRFYGKPHRVLYFYHLLGNKVITYLFNALFNQTLTDLETCYKMFRRSIVQGINLRCVDFGIEVELSALFATTKNCRIYELGIHYFGRTYEDGKKINWRDGFQALWYVVRFRLMAPKRN